MKSNNTNDSPLVNLFAATAKGDLQEVKRLIEEGAVQFDARSERGSQAIHFAAQNGHLNIVEYLAGEGADVNAKNNNGSQAIHLTAQNGHLNIVEYLAREGADFNAKDNYGFQAIHLAAHNGHLNIVEYLAREGADVNAKNNNGSQAIHFAAQNGHLNIVEYLAREGADVNAKNNDGFQAIHLAAHNGHLNIVEYLAREGADVNAKNNNGSQAIHFAAQNGHLNIVEYLAREGADVNAKNNDGFQAIHLAAHNGHLNIVEYLAREGADVNAKNNDGFQAIHLAAQNGHLNIVEYLAREGADVNAKNNDGFRPIHSATQNGHLNIVEYLAGEGADFNAKDNYGFQPIHLAAQSGHLNIVEYLAREGADVNAKNNNGFQPIHSAAQEGRLDIVRYLAEEKMANPSDLLYHASYHYSEKTDAVIRYLLANHLKKYDLNGKIDEIKKITRENLSYIPFRADSQKLAALTRVFKEEFVKSIIPENSTILLNDLIPRSFVNIRSTSNFSSPCDTFNILSELGSTSSAAFTSSVLPSQQPQKKTIILDVESFEKDAIKLPIDQRKDIIKTLINNGFDVYLCTENNANPKFTQLNSTDGLLAETLTKTNSARFIVNEQNFNQLLELNPSISHDNLLNPTLEQLFFVSLLSQTKSLGPENSQRSKELGNLNIQNLQLINRSLSNVKPVISQELVRETLALATVSIILLLGALILYNMEQRAHDSSNITGDTSDHNVDVTHQDLANSIGENLHKVMNRGFSLFGASKIAEVIYDFALTNHLPNWPDSQASNPIKKKAYIATNAARTYKIGGDKSGVATYDMQEIGEVLNRDIDQIYVRTAVKELSRNEEGGIFLSEKNPIALTDILDYETINESDLARYKKSKDGTYFQFSTNLPGDDKLTRLFSSDANENLVGILENPAEIMIQKGDDGFLYARSAQPTKLSYVLHSEQELGNHKVEELLSYNHPIQTILDDYMDEERGFTMSSKQSFLLPTDDIGKTQWLDELYEARQGSCNQRASAVYNRIINDYPEQKQNVRIVGIDNNHDLLEVREKDGAKWISVDLGGTTAERIFHQQEQKPQSWYHSWFTNGQNDQTDWTSIGFTFLVSALNLISIALTKDGRAQRRKKYDVEDTETTAGTNITEVVKDLLKKKLHLETIGNQEEVFSKIQANQRTLLVSKNSDDAANFLIRKFCNQGEKVFYLDSPNKIFQKRNLNLNGGKAEIINSDLLTEFVKNCGDENCTIIINWSAFNNNQIIALNTILDKDCRVGDLVIRNQKIVSLTETTPTDNSFLSRHQSCINSTCDFKTAEEVLENNASQKQQKDPTPIDLEGVIDWEQKLFGFTRLEGNEIKWSKGEFLTKIEQGENNFETKNISSANYRKLERLIAEANSRRLINYNGYQVVLNSDITLGRSEQSFDFSKFSNLGISTKSNTTLSTAPKNAYLANSFFFDYLLKRNEIHEKNYFEADGLIKENSGQELNLFITSALSDDQYYSMLSEIERCNVKANLYLAKNVNLPSGITANQTKESEKKSEPETQTTFNIIVSNDPNLAVKQIQKSSPSFAVIDVEDYNYQQLFEEIKFDRSNGGYENFELVTSEFAQKLSSGEKIILKGDFPNPLLLAMQSLILNNPTAKENLTLIIEDKKIREGQNEHEALSFLDKTQYQIQYFNPANKTKSSKIELLEDTKLSDEFDLENSVEKSAEFIQQRKNSFAQILQDHSMMQLIGHSGVGKSHLLKITKDEDPRYEIYNEMANFEDWANDKSDKIKILFIDEANIEDSHLTKFSPLKNLVNEEKVKILHDKKFYELGKNHKVVFARNPLNYSQGRVPQKLFDDDVPSLYLRDFSPQYVYEEILKKPIYDQLSPDLKTQIDEEKFKEKSQILLKNYQRFNQKNLASHNETACKTVRELQEEVLLYLKKELFPTAEEKPELISKNFISTDATSKIEESLTDFIEIRTLQKNKIFGDTPSGLNAFIIEGDPGVGKSELINAVFVTKNISEGDPALENNGEQKYYKILAGMPSQKKKEIIVKAFEEGNAVWIDEFNSCINDDGLEKTLNAALTGQHPEGKKDFESKAGFMLVASINPAIMEGRSQLSPAIKHRATTHQAPHLKDYDKKDLQKICAHSLGSQTPDQQDVAKTIANLFMKELQSESGALLSLRDLSDITTNVLQAHKPGVSVNKAQKHESGLRQRSANSSIPITV